MSPRQGYADIALPSRPHPALTLQLKAFFFPRWCVMEWQRLRLRLRSSTIGFLSRGSMGSYLLFQMEQRAHTYLYESEAASLTLVLV